MIPGSGARPDFGVAKLGPCTIASPLHEFHFIDDRQSVLFDDEMREIKKCLAAGSEPEAFEQAGPREKIFFDPAQLRCGIVTCGGLCPGLNDVIQSVVYTLFRQYGVGSVLGFRFGYEGLTANGLPPMDLTPDTVRRIHEVGGTALGSSRGNQDAAEMVNTLEKHGIGALFTVGGDGTLRGAHAIAEEIQRRRSKIAVIGIPKTIDNDISFIQTTFGFETAVSEARRATSAAYVEASSYRNGIGLVKLMGRDSGFIAAYAALADRHVNFCLIPEDVFTLNGLISALHARLDRRHYAVIVVAEGAGQELMKATNANDASGNVRYADIGAFLRDRINEHFKSAGMNVSLKYIDPSYMIRSLPANTRDAAFCLLLGQCAVHAAMAGRTDIVVGHWRQKFTHVPIPLAVSSRKKVDLDSFLWKSAIASTGQPAKM